ncbi:MAG: MFS transporter [Desulfovibrio sp.]|jgi:MFS family permease|nr:MFS transporter [Desulfovibrio sp.]
MSGPPAHEETPGGEKAPASLHSYEFWALCAVSLLCFCNLAIFYGFYNYLEYIGIDPKWRGPLLALEPLTALVLRPWLSGVLNLANSTRAMRMGALIALSALASYPLAQGIPAIAMVRVLHGAGYVTLASGVMAAFTHILPRDRVAQGFGLLSLTSLLPSALMPPFVEAVTPLLPGPGWAYAMASPLMVVALLLLAPLGRRTAALAASLPPEQTARPAWAEILSGLREPGVAALLLGQFCLLGGYTVVYFFTKSLSLSLGAANPGLFFTCANLATVALRVLGMRRLDGLNPGRTAGLSLLFLGILIPCFAQAPRLGPHGEAALLGMAVLYGLAIGLCMPLFNAAMFRVSAPRLRATNANLLLVALDAGFILGPVAAGWALAAGASLQGLYVMGGAALLAAGALVIPVGRLTPGQARPQADRAA